MKSSRCDAGFIALGIGIIPGMSPTWILARIGRFSMALIETEVHSSFRFAGKAGSLRRGKSVQGALSGFLSDQEWQDIFDDHVNNACLAWVDFEAHKGLITAVALQQRCSA